MKPGEMIAQLNRLVLSIHLVGKREQEPGWRHHPREQKFYSLWFVTKGKGTFTLDGNPHNAEPGKLFIFTPGMMCERRADSDTPLEYYFLRFSYAVAYEEQDQWYFQGSDEIAFPLAGGYTIQNPPEVINLLEQIHRLWRRKGPVMVLRKKILFQEFWLAIARDFRAQKVSGNPVMAIDLTIDYMGEHYKEPIRLKDLADMAGLSASHYSRLFRQYMGYSPIEYLTRLRVDRAKELIVLSDYKSKAISRSVGYRDEFYFSRVFKKRVGCSPSEYAQRYRLGPGNLPS